METSGVEVSRSNFLHRPEISRYSLLAGAIGSGAGAFCSGAGDRDGQGFFFFRRRGRSKHPREPPGAQEMEADELKAEAAAPPPRTLKSSP